MDEVGTFKRDLGAELMHRFYWRSLELEPLEEVCQCCTKTCLVADVRDFDFSYQPDFPQEPVYMCAACHSKGE